MSSKGVRIEVNDLIKVYKSGSAQVIALKGLGMTVEAGEIVSIMGPSGCGKTTLLNIIGGLDKPTAGRVLVDGLDITQTDGRALDRYRLKEVGCIFQFFNLMPEMTAWQNVQLPMRLAKLDPLTISTRTLDLMSKVLLLERSMQRPGELSGGEQQRVAIACALANDPPLLLADEPTGELDRETAKHVIGLLAALIREFHKTSIMVTHDPMVATHADRVLRMEDGRITGEYTPDQLAQLAEASRPRDADKIKARIEGVKREVERLEGDFRAGRLASDQFVEQYNALKRTLKILQIES